MIILPILVDDKIYNATITFKNIEQINSIYRPSDIIANGQSYNNSAFNCDNCNLNNIINFIRTSDYGAKSDVVVTSKALENGKYSAYIIKGYPYNICEGLDQLYASVVLDLKNNKNITDRNRYISLKKMGITTHIDNTDLRKAVKALSSGTDSIHTKKIYDTLLFMSMFKGFIIEDAVIDKKSVEDVKTLFDTLSIKEKQAIGNYYEYAKDNSKELAKLDYMCRSIIGEPLNLLYNDTGKKRVKINHE